MEMISNRRRVTETSFDLVFDFVEQAGCGFSFPCDEQGNVLPLPEVARENFRKCMAGEYPVKSGVVRKAEHSYMEYAVGRCVCRRRVVLSHFTNKCSCGRFYNFAGQLLASPDQWGEETGEHWTECL